MNITLGFVDIQANYKIRNTERINHRLRFRMIFSILALFLCDDFNVWCLWLTSPTSPLLPSSLRPYLALKIGYKAAEGSCKWRALRTHEDFETTNWIAIRRSTRSAPHAHETWTHSHEHSTHSGPGVCTVLVGLASHSPGITLTRSSTRHTCRHQHLPWVRAAVHGVVWGSCRGEGEREERLMPRRTRIAVDSTSRCSVRTPFFFSKDSPSNPKPSSLLPSPHSVVHLTHCQFLWVEGHSSIDVDANLAKSPTSSADGRVVGVGGGGVGRK